MAGLTPGILYEDNHLIVVQKPFCMPSQGDPSGDQSLFDWVKEYIRTTYNKPGNVYLALIHRLDRPVGGVMVFGKTSKAAGRLSNQFRDKKVEKVYHAVVESPPEQLEGKLVHFMKRAVKGRNIHRAYNKEVHGTKKAVLEYKQLAVKDGRALLEVRPITGRQHQIRVQLAAMRCTIVGDVKYGKTNFLPDKSIALMAVELGFEHPVKKDQMIFRATPPDVYPWDLFS